MPHLLPRVVSVDYVVLITNQNLAVVGDPIVCWKQIDVTLRFNEPGSGIVVTPGYPWIVEQIQDGNRVVVIRNHEILIAGPIEKWLHERSDDGQHAGDGTLTVNFADDFARVAAREVYPNPAQTVEGQTADVWTFTGGAESALRDLVNLNAGPGALAPRRIPQLALGAVAGVGSTVTVAATRMQHLGDLARSIAEVGGQLGFRTRQSGTQILFEVYESEDKSGTVRFGFGLGNMKYISYERTAPTVTTAIVGGQGAGADRFMIERADAVAEAAWGRFEKLTSRPGSSALQELEDDATRSLAEGAATDRLATNVADTEDQSFGTHYQIGDIVSVESHPHQQVTGVVRTVHLQTYATSGEYVSATVGSQAATSDPAWARRLREIDDRLGRIERTVTPA